MCFLLSPEKLLRKTVLLVAMMLQHIGAEFFFWKEKQINKEVCETLQRAESDHLHAHQSIEASPSFHVRSRTQKQNDLDLMLTSFA
jgi:hypothetical protein